MSPFSFRFYILLLEFIIKRITILVLGIPIRNIGHDRFCDRVDTWIPYLLILFLFEAYETVLNDPTLCRPPYYSPGTISCSNIRTCYSRWSTFLFYDDNRTRWRKYCCLVLVGITTARNPPAWGEIPKKQKGLLLLLLVFYLWRKSNETMYHIFVHSIKMF